LLLNYIKRVFGLPIQDGIYPAKPVHFAFIVDEILKEAAKGNFNPDCVRSVEHRASLKSQIKTSISKGHCRTVSGDATSRIAVIYKDNEVCGFSWSVAASANSIELLMLSVRDENRGDGLGKKMLRESLSIYPEGYEVIVRIYKDEYKLDHNRYMQKMILNEGFREESKQNKSTNQFVKLIT
jgi:hypothetical protein